jgi:hypothetical protein
MASIFVNYDYYSISHQSFVRLKPFLNGRYVTGRHLSTFGVRYFKNEQGEQLYAGTVGGVNVAAVVVWKEMNACVFYKCAQSLMHWV